jgi:hypothetical protein
MSLSKRLLRSAYAAAILLTAGSTAVLAADSRNDAKSVNDLENVETIENVQHVLPVVFEHRYRMLAKVRPLLFWISKDDVGGAKVSWRRDDAGAFGLDLLIGSDPLRAPRKINKWGYIAEELRGSDARVIGIMKQSNEQSVADAEKQLGAEGKGGFTYRAIQGTASAREARAGVTSVNVARDLTYRDIDSLLSTIGDSEPRAKSRTVALPPGTRPGFLVALHDLVSGTTKSTVTYVYFGVFYDLTMKGSTPLKNATIDGKPYTNLARSDFEIRNRSNGETTKFQLTYGTQGLYAGIPVHAVYQPRWWFEVQLFLDERAAF